MNSITYGIGGELSDHPNGNVVERIVDNGDGTGTRTTYDEHGNETSVKQLTGLPIPTPVDERPEPMLAQLAALGAALLADPERFAAMVAQMTGANAAKGPLTYIADALKTVEALESSVP